MSRDETNIRETLEHVASGLIPIQSSKVDPEIKTYVRNRHEHSNPFKKLPRKKAYKKSLERELMGCGLL
jgi:hypothetical protein